MQLVCKDSKHQKTMVRMLQSDKKEKNFLFLDPGDATIRSKCFYTQVMQLHIVYYIKIKTFLYLGNATIRLKYLYTQAMQLSIRSKFGKKNYVY